MELSSQSLTEFANAWEDEFGQKLSPEEARIQAERLLELARLLSGSSADYQP